MRIPLDSLEISSTGTRWKPMLFRRAVRLPIALIQSTVLQRITLSSTMTMKFALPLIVVAATQLIGCSDGAAQGLESPRLYCLYM